MFWSERTESLLQHAGQEQVIWKAGDRMYQRHIRSRIAPAPDPLPSQRPGRPSIGGKFSVPILAAKLRNASLELAQTAYPDASKACLGDLEHVLQRGFAAIDLIVVAHADAIPVIEASKAALHLKHTAPS